MYKPIKLPPKEYILEKYIYDKDSGTLRLNRPNSRVIGFRSKSKNYHYLRITLPYDGRIISFSIHRIIFFLETGEEPIEIDHIDNNARNNHISNLRAANRSENRFNSRGKSNKTSKYKGVSWSNGFWRVYIKINGKSYFLGKFLNEIDAAKIYDFNAKKFFGKFANLNFSEKLDIQEEDRVRELSLLVKRRIKSSKYVGVSLHCKGLWRARFKNELLGYFKEEKEAAKAYNQKCIEVFGENAVLNEIGH